MDYALFQSKIGILRSFHYPHYTLKSTAQRKTLRKSIMSKPFKTRVALRYLHGDLDNKRIKYLLKDLL